MNEEELARLHKALSVPVRLKIVRLIAGRPLCVNAITRFLQISQPAVSQHLAVLRQADLVRGEKRGYMVHYTLNRVRLQELRHAVDSFPEEPLSVSAETEEAAAAGDPAQLAAKMEPKSRPPIPQERGSRRKKP
jgi:ArsR family transcriptional regulator